LYATESTNTLFFPKSNFNKIFFTHIRSILQAIQPDEELLTFIERQKSKKKGKKNSKKKELNLIGIFK
jgi:hypothetical protein